MARGFVADQVKLDLMVCVTPKVSDPNVVNPTHPAKDAEDGWSTQPLEAG